MSNPVPPSLPRWDDADVVSFVGTDYLGRSADQTVRSAAIEAINRHGVSAGAARTTTGTKDVHVELEQALARFLEVDDVVVLASGGHAGAAVVEALRDQVDTWWIDEYLHHSARAPLAGVSRVHTYPHCDPEQLADRSQEDPASRRALLTDAVFPEVGRAVEIDKIAAATGSSVLLCVDESHSIGVLGAAGRGLAHALAGQRDYVQFGSLAKAFGGFGGFVAGGREVCDAVRAHSGAYTTSTALPPAICAALLAAVATMGEGAESRAALFANVAQMRSALVALELAAPESRVPIFFVSLADQETATKWHERLLDDGLFVPTSGYLSATGLIGLRWVVTARHQPDDIARLGARLQTLAETGG